MTELLALKKRIKQAKETLVNLSNQKAVLTSLKVLSKENEGKIEIINLYSQKYESLLRELNLRAMQCLAYLSLHEIKPDKKVDGNGFHRVD